jgi:ribosomal protein S18 acetylase RimI-like enzyme
MKKTKNKSVQERDFPNPKNEIVLYEGGKEMLDSIAPLWKKLTLQHAGFSPFFAEEFRNRTFKDRKQELLSKTYRNRLHVILARSKGNNRIVGYAVGTVDRRKTAELDSLFVEKQFRNRGIGSRLVQRMVDWLNRQHPAVVTVNVAVGNEATFDFYRRFGFFPRVTTLLYKQ